MATTQSRERLIGYLLDKDDAAAADSEIFAD